MPDLCAAPLLYRWVAWRYAIFAIAALTALALSGAPGHSEAAGQPPNRAAAIGSGPYPDPGNDLTDPGIPGNPPPPPGGVDAPGPGSPDSGVALAPAGPARVECALPVGVQQQVCFKPDAAAKYNVSAVSANNYAFKIIDTATADGTLLRTTPFAANGFGVLPLLANTTVSIADNSPYPRTTSIKVVFTLLDRTEDFLCEVGIHNPYFPDDWRNQTKCTWTGLNSWLAKFTNYGDRPVDVNEWYRGARHGRTEVPQGESIVMPLHAQGEYYVGAGGPPGPPIKLTVTDYQIANHLKELWVRDHAKIQPDTNTLAVNLSPYPVRLSWQEDDRVEVPLPSYGRVETPYALGRVITGEKNYGNGEVARVVFLDPTGIVGETYFIRTPAGTDLLHPIAIVQVLAQQYRSVKLFNRGPYPVRLTAWFIPLFSSVGSVRLGVGETGILPLYDIGARRAAMMITALISPPAPDLITRVEATDWEICRPNNCYSSFAGTVNSLTGNATGLTTGELRLQMRGRLPLTRSNSRDRSRPRQYRSA